MPNCWKSHVAAQLSFLYLIWGWICVCFSLTQFQELIAEQTEIVSNNQLLIFDGQLLTEFIQPMQAIVDYPKGINENNPVVCFNKVADESYKFPDFSISKYIVYIWRQQPV